MTNKEKAYNEVVNHIFYDELSGGKHYSVKRINHMLNYAYALYENNDDMILLKEYNKNGLGNSKLAKALKARINTKYNNIDLAKDIRRSFDSTNNRYDN